MRLIRANFHMPRARWFWSVGIGLVLGALVIVFVLWNVNGQAPKMISEPLVNDSNAVVALSLSTSSEQLAMTVETQHKKIRLNFLPGSVEEACDFNELPPYWVNDGSQKRNNINTNALESDECWVALDAHMSTVNPYHFYWSSLGRIPRPMEFVVLDDPLTFERIFADPTGDLHRVQNALSQPECLLKGNETNWELEETCHAEAFLNYALINFFCFGEGINRRHHAYYLPDDQPTPHQDRLMWKQDLEDDWVRMKCEELNPALELNSKNYPTLYELVEPIQVWDSEERKVLAFLVELSARLGDETAGLTESGFSGFPAGNGYKYGRFSKLLFSDEWQRLRWAGATMRKYSPSSESESSSEYFLETFHFLVRIGTRRPDFRDEVQFDWEWVVQHLCAPVYLPPSLLKAMGIEEREPAELQSCKEIVHELRQQDIRFRPLLDVLDKFEQVALDLGVYE